MTRILPLVLLFAISTAPALARSLDESEDRGSDSDRSACTPDVFRLCSAHIPNVPNIVACLKSEKRNLSAECKVVFDRRPVRKVKHRE